MEIEHIIVNPEKIKERRKIAVALALYIINNNDISMTIKTNDKEYEYTTINLYYDALHNLFPLITEYLEALYTINNGTFGSDESYTKIIIEMFKEFFNKEKEHICHTTEKGGNNFIIIVKSIPKFSVNENVITVEYEDTKEDITYDETLDEYLDYYEKTEEKKKEQLKTHPIILTTKGKR